jgi:hypothetical protein
MGEVEKIVYVDKIVEVEKKVFVDKIVEVDKMKVPKVRHAIKSQQQRKANTELYLVFGSTCSCSLKP